VNEDEDDDAGNNTVRDVICLSARITLSIGRAYR
jgi:hypothetical protein